MSGDEVLAAALEPVPGGGGQSMAAEQTRAAAEVYAAMQAAKMAPRVESEAIRRIEVACRQPELADRAFYRFNRGGQQVTGPTIQLAQELARCWGNMSLEVKEVSRDVIGGVSHMSARAWDMENNVVQSTTFVVPHARDKRDGPAALSAPRDIYENNANAAARRLREMAFRVMPNWFVDKATALCKATLGGEHDETQKPLPVRVADAVARFGDEFGVDADQLEDKLGRDQSRWNAHDLAELRVIYAGLSERRVRVETEFPKRVLTAGDLAGDLAGAAPAEPTPTPGDDGPSREIADQWSEAIDAADEIDALNEVARDAQETNLDAQDRKIVDAMIAERRRRLAV